MDPLIHFKNDPFRDRALVYLIVNFRWIFVMIFLLPLSVVYKFFFDIRNKIEFYLNSGPNLHDARVKNIQKEIRNWRDSGTKQKLCTARSTWKTMSFRKGLYKQYNRNININLVDILSIDTDKRVVRVEPLVTMGQLTTALLPMGWTVPVVPELDDLTIGGLLMGTGIETSSHKYGLYQHICVGLELVLSNGELVKCSPTENEDLFYAAFWSYGTLGFLVSAEIKIIPAKKFVKVEYYPCHSTDTIVEKFQKETMKESNNEFVEAITFSKDTGVVMTANMSDEPKNKTEINFIGKYYKPWFFKHVEKYLKSKGDMFTEYIPIRDYYHRHSRSIFWELQDIIPFGNNPLFRYLLGWAVPPKISFLKLTTSEATKKLYDRSHMLQDFLVPIRGFGDSLKEIDKECGIYPLWICPFKLPEQPGMLQPNFDKTNKNSPFENTRKGDRWVMYVDIGIYGVPKVLSYDPVKTTRKVEAFVTQAGGFQMMYADTYMTKAEFRKMFDHSLYDKMRLKYDCELAFPEVYDKVSKMART